MSKSPEHLSEWTVDIIEELCRNGQVETDRHDFKFGLPDSDGLTKLCCAFANARGGFVVIGVKDYNGRFVPAGIEPDIDIAQQFGTKLRADPSIPFEAPSSIEARETGRVFYVFHVPQSPNAPHLPTAADKRMFWKRTHSGCEQMSHREIQVAFANFEERRQRLGLLVAELDASNYRLRQFLKSGPDVIRYVSFDVGVIEQTLVDGYSLIQSIGGLRNALFGIRESLRSLQMEVETFRAELAMLPAPLKPHLRQDLICKHNASMAGHAHQLVPLIDQAIRSLAAHFALRLGE